MRSYSARRIAMGRARLWNGIDREREKRGREGEKKKV